MASSALSIKEDILAALKDILMRHLPAPEIRPSPIDGLVLVRREDPPASDRCFEKPLIAIIVQGGKRSLIGSQEFVFRRGQFLVSGIDMPSSSSFFDTAPGQPFLSLFFYLDRQILTDLMLRMRPAGKTPQEDGPGVAVADAEPEFLEAVLRLAELLDKPEQIAIRAPMILQELHYLLLIGPLGMCCADSMPRARRTARSCRPSPSCAGIWGPRYAWRAWHGRWACPCPRSIVISRPSPA